MSLTALDANPQEDLRVRYREMRPGWEPAGTIYRRLVVQAAPVAGRVLDVGCGRKGFPLDRAPEQLRLFGVDPDESAVACHEILSLRAAAHGERLPFTDGSFDLVCCGWVLEHVDRPRGFVSEICRVLAPGGRFAFVTPNARNPVTWMIRGIPNRLHPPIMRLLQRRHGHDTYPVRYRMNTPSAIEQIMTDAGFERERLVVNGDPTYAAIGPRSLRLAAGAERLLDIPGLRGARIHLIGVYRKPLGSAGGS